MKKVKIGIFGIRRGSDFYNKILQNNGDIVAVCDIREDRLEEAREKLGKDIACYTDFDKFIEHEGMEAVFLCNFFHEHAPYAIKALERNIHVLSECTSNGTMAEGVALVRAAEKSRAFYMLAENYPFMKQCVQIKKVCDSGTLGKFLYAEGEYNHPVNPEDKEQTEFLRPFPEHWRNYAPRTYYLTHSLAPLKYFTGATPVRVTAMPVYCEEQGEDALFGPEVKDRAAVITCLNDDNSVFRIFGCSGFAAAGSSYRVCGDKGQVENIRGTYGSKMLVQYNQWNTPEGQDGRIKFYEPEWEDEQAELIKASGHNGGDFLIIREFFNCVRENKKPLFDEYFATNMASVAILGHRSLLELGVPYDIPDFRKEEDRKKYENDYETPFYGSDGSKPTVRCSSR